LKLREILDEEHAIVLVGLDEQQLSDLPNDILGISRTANPRELAEIYSAADVFFNPTYEDNLPTVNLEAESCGTRVITYDTGGSAETLNRQDSIAIPVGHYSRVAEELR
jgi:glycosyltransferase involved in cell wall biosynthesis